MAISYKKKEQKVWCNGKLEEKYVAKIAYNSRLNEGALAEEIASKTTASAADVMLVLTALEECISSNIARGNVIKMDILGSFYPAITAKAVDSPDKVNQFSITNKRVKFVPSQSFKDRLKEAGVRLYDPRVYPADPHANSKKEKSTEE